MTPQLRFPEFTDEWQVKKLGEVVDNVGGTALEKHVNPAGSHKFISIGNYSTDGRYTDNGQRIILNDKTITKLLNENDIAMVLNDKTASGDIIGSSILINENDRFIYNQRTERLVPRTTVSPRFLWLQLNSTSFRKKVFSIAQGGTQIYVNYPSVKKLQMTLPSKPEQEKIADFLTAVDERIAVGEKKLELLETYKRGVMQKIFTQQIRFKDDNGNPYPDWEEKKLGELEDEGFIKLGRGNVISKIDIKKYPGEYPIYSSSVKNEGLFGKYGRYMFDEELVTWSVDGGGDFFYRSSQKFSITNVSGWLRVLSSTLNCRFLATQLQILHEKQKFDYTSKAHPSVIRNIYTLKIPAIEEQQKIATFLAALDDKITAEKSKLTATHQFKKALLQRMFV